MKTVSLVTFRSTSFTKVLTDWAKPFLNRSSHYFPVFILAFLNFCIIGFLCSIFVRCRWLIASLNVLVNLLTPKLSIFSQEQVGIFRTLHTHLDFEVWVHFSLCVPHLIRSRWVVPSDVFSLLPYLTWLCVPLRNITGCRTRAIGFIWRGFGIFTVINTLFHLILEMLSVWWRLWCKRGIWRLLSYSGFLLSEIWRLIRLYMPTLIVFYWILLKLRLGFVIYFLFLFFLYIIFVSNLIFIVVTFYLLRIGWLEKFRHFWLTFFSTIVAILAFHLFDIFFWCIALR